MDDKACQELARAVSQRAAELIASKEEGSGTCREQKCPPLAVPEREEIRGALLPWLRGQISQQKRFIGTIQTDEQILRFVNSQDAEPLAALGTSCPDHFLLPIIKPLSVNWTTNSREAKAPPPLPTDGVQRHGSNN